MERMDGHATPSGGRAGSVAGAPPSAARAFAALGRFPHPLVFMPTPRPFLALPELTARLLEASAEAEELLLGFWVHHRLEVADVAAPIDRAVLGGVCADRVAWAFLAGYQAALCALIPSHDADRVAAFCVTEVGGAHPRAVLSELRPSEGGGYALSGHKRWSSTVPAVEVLYVVAREGLDVAGHPHLRVAKVDAQREGVRFEAMPPAPFVPEVPHGEVFLTDVAVSPSELLPGDGYSAYVKAFRNAEDLYVNAALLGYLLGAARRFAAPSSMVERLFSAIVSARSLALEDARAAATHLALAGLLATVQLAAADVLAHLATLSSDEARAEHARLLRDVALLGVAAKAREQRRKNAWAALATDSPDADADEHAGGDLEP